MNILVSALVVLFVSCDKSTDKIEEASLGEPFFASEITREVDKVNPPNTPNGGRGTDQMVVYTPLYGSQTNTNEWGIEVIVENEVVTSIGGNNSVIPRDGMVISGHGAAAAWINKHMNTGDNIKISGSTLKVIVSENSKVQRGQILIRKGKNRLETVSHSSIDPITLHTLERQFISMESQFVNAKQQADSALAKTLAEAVLSSAIDYYYYTFPSLENHERSAWLEIHGMSKSQLEWVFKDMADIGFNAVCPEVIYRGWAIYPDAPNGLNQYPEFIGRDPLQEMIDLGKKYNIKIIPWVWVYFIGVDHFPDLINNRSEWLAISRTGKHPSQAEAGFYYFCPSRPEVRDFWLDIYQDMFFRYDISDLQLDYIRYPGEPWTNDYCYCEVCRENFRNQNDGVDPLNITPDKNPELWEKWNLYRQENVNRFVQSVSGRFPQINLSAAVVPDRETSLAAKKQDWGKWLQNSWLKTVYIMSYTSDVHLVGNQIDYMNNQLTTQTKGIVGLGPYAGMKPEILLEEIDLARIKDLDGACLFIFNALTQEQKYALKQGPYRNKTLSK